MKPVQVPAFSTKEICRQSPAPTLTVFVVSLQACVGPDPSTVQVKVVSLNVPVHPPVACWTTIVQESVPDWAVDM